MKKFKELKGYYDDDLLSCEELQHISFVEVNIALDVTDVAFLDEEVTFWEDHAVVFDEELGVHLAGHQQEVPRLAGQHPPHPGRQAELNPLSRASAVLI